MILTYFNALMFILISEMGDKTQILAMTFATKYSLKKVFLGIFIGSLLNHALAVYFGSLLNNHLPIEIIQIIAGIAFIGFGIWSLKIDEDSDEEVKIKYGPVITVSLAFFIGELGDKTQLAAITLAADSNYALLTLAGTVSGMLIASLVGIIIGIKLGNKIPEVIIKLCASAIFITFGYIKLINGVPNEYLTWYYILSFSIVLLVVVLLLLKPIITPYNDKRTAFKAQSERLYNFYHKVKLNIDDICLSPKVCGVCENNNCVVGYTKNLLKGYINKDKDILKINDFKEFNIDKKFDQNKLKTTHKLIINYLKEDYNENVDFVRKLIEYLLYKEFINEFDNYENYKLNINKLIEKVKKP